MRAKRIVAVRVTGLRGTHYALPEHLEGIEQLAEPHGTHLICPFDSLLWQRKRAEQLLDFVYRIEIYVPASKRQFGYYVLPILHDGRFVGRLDPTRHRDRGQLEIKAIHLEPGFRRGRRFDTELAEALRDMATFVGAETLEVPRPWRRALC